MSLKRKILLFYPLDFVAAATAEVKRALLGKTLKNVARR
jgi:hypothetical protein